LEDFSECVVYIANGALNVADHSASVPPNASWRRRSLGEDWAPRGLDVTFLGVRLACAQAQGQLAVDDEGSAARFAGV